MPKKLNFLIPAVIIGKIIDDKTSVDENAAREATYKEASERHSLPAKGADCYGLESLMKNVSADIRAYEEKKTRDSSAGNQRIQNRYIDGYTRYLNELQYLYNNMQCERAEAELEEQKFFEQQQQQLESVKQLTQQTSNTSKYIIWGMLGLIVIVAGIIVIKKVD